VRPIRADELARHAEVVSRGFAGDGDVPPSYPELFRLSCQQPGATCFGAFLEGAPVGGGTAVLLDDVAFFVGASTLPAFRRRGAQSALLAARLRHALAQGCAWATITTVPGSDSQRNVERPPTASLPRRGARNASPFTAPSPACRPPGGFRSARAPA